MSGKTQAPKRQQPTNFLEALRELGRDVTSEAKVQVKQVFAQDIPDSLGMPHSTGTLNPKEQVSVDQLRGSQPEQKTDVVLQQRLHQMREEEQSLTRKRETEIKEQIKQIQIEIKQLAKAAGDFAAEVEIATMQATVNPGKYHEHFFARLKITIALLRKRVNDSQAWLSEHNRRSQKQGYYWSQVKKSGTSYMLSSERYMVTSTG